MLEPHGRLLQTPRHLDLGASPKNRINLPFDIRLSGGEWMLTRVIRIALFSAGGSVSRRFISSAVQAGTVLRIDVHRGHINHFADAHRSAVKSGRSFLQTMD
jgi:hypothetical protein